MKKYSDWELSHCSNCGGELVPGFFGKHKDPSRSCGDGRNAEQFDHALAEELEIAGKESKKCPIHNKNNSLCPAKELSRTELLLQLAKILLGLLVGGYVIYLLRIIAKQ